jgi:uncharacterized protein (DUF2141 family)
MLKLLPPIIAGGTLALATAPTPAQALGPDATSCRNGGPALLVNVSGFKNRAGKLRVQLYGSNPADFLAKGKKLRRIDLPVTGNGPMQICIAVPRAGTYGGFSRNPRISLTSPKPKYGDVAISVSNGVKPVDVVLNYRSGLSIRPVGKS